MLIQELLEQKITEDDFAGDIEIQNTLEDILVQLHHRGMDSVGLEDIAGELSKAVDSVQINPNEPDFLELLRTALEQNERVQSISPNNQVVLKKPGQDDDQEEPEDQTKQDKKMNKMANRNIKKKSKAGEL